MPFHFAHVVRIALVSLAVVVASSPIGAQLQTMEITRIADGVYGAIYSEMVDDPVQSNSLIIIGDEGVCVVDAHYTPSAARATIAEIRKLTALPVRYVVATHWHDDHVFGNNAYRDAFPGVQFVAQQATRASMVAYAAKHLQQLVTAYDAAGPKAEARLSSGLGADGKPLSAEDRADYATLLPIYRTYAADFKTVEIVMPTITFDRQLTLHLGRREVQVRSFGAGNTEGDAIIFLPAEKIAAVGDLVVYPVPFIYGGFPASWVDVLRSVRALGAETIVPGHGPVMRDFSYVDRISALMQSMATQAKAAVAKGLSLEDTRKAMDLKAFHDQFVDGKDGREGTWESSIIESGIKAAYDEAKSLAPPKFTITKVATGVHSISRTEVLKQPLDGNAVVIEGDDAVAVVDATQTYTSANEVIAEIRRLTSKPVKYLINTHWHNDHVQGNAAFVKAWPAVQIVAHEFTRDDIVSETAGVLAGRIRSLGNRDQFQQQLDAGTNAAGAPLSDAERHRLRERLAMPLAHLGELKEIVITPPTVTYRGRTSLQLGGREVQLFSNGPGNTRSDTVVWLPADRVLASGDLLVTTVPFMSVSFPRGWLARLNEIDAMAPAVIIPGHGAVQRDRSWLNRHAALLTSLIRQVDQALADGLTLDATRRRVNLDDFRAAYSGGDAALAREFDFRVTEPAVVDAYREKARKS